jgi:hypothetical protein
MSIQTNLTADQILSQLDALRLAYLSGTLEVRFSDGKAQRFQSTGDILKAIQTGEDWLRTMNGTTESRVGLAQHKRGDGPSGPSRDWNRCS